jgi:hypothetical protein
LFSFNVVSNYSQELIFHEVATKLIFCISPCPRKITAVAEINSNSKHLFLVLQKSFSCSQGDSQLTMSLFRDKLIVRLWATSSTWELMLLFFTEWCNSSYWYSLSEKELTTEQFSRWNRKTHWEILTVQLVFILFDCIKLWNRGTKSHYMSYFFACISFP